MTTRLPRLLLAAGLLFALALPSAALAHGGRHHERDRSHACRAVDNGRVPRGLTAAQAQSIATACATRAAAVKAANDAFAAATKSARDTYRATVAPLNAQVRAAAAAKRAACRADRRSQACANARAAFRSTITSLAPQYRAARSTFRTAVGPAAQTRAAARARRPAGVPRCGPPGARGLDPHRVPPAAAIAAAGASGGIPLPRRRDLPTMGLRLLRPADAGQPPGSERRAAGSSRHAPRSPLRHHRDHRRLAPPPARPRRREPRRVPARRPRDAPPLGVDDAPTSRSPLPARGRTRRPRAAVLAGRSSRRTRRRCSAAGSSEAARRAAAR